MISYLFKMFSSLKTFNKIFWGNKWNIWAKKTLNSSLKNPLTLLAKAVFESGRFSSSENMENIMYRYLFCWKDVFILKNPKIYSLQESVLKIHWSFWFCFVSEWHQQWLSRGSSACPPSYQLHTEQGMFTADPAGWTTNIHNSPFQQSYSSLQLQTWTLKALICGSHSKAPHWFHWDPPAQWHWNPLCPLWGFPCESIMLTPNLKLISW